MTCLDNAATTFPKPPQVYGAADRFMREIGASPGRSAHRNAVRAAREIFDTRERVASFFNVKDAGRVIFTCNATEALNLAILGSVGHGDRVAVSSLEHNAVMRPIRFLAESRGVILDIVPYVSDMAGWKAAPFTGGGQSRIKRHRFHCAG